MSVQITEQDILTTYLLTPSSLQTLLPYSKFLQTIVPPTPRKNPAYSSALRTIYRDFTVQRALTVDRVREAIEKQAGAGSITLRADLIRRLVLEEGGRGRERERRLKGNGLRRRDEVVNTTIDESGSDVDSGSGSESESHEEYTRQSRLERTSVVTEQVMADDPLSVHAAAHVLPCQSATSRRRPRSQLLEQQLRDKYDRRFHTEDSLLEAMNQAENSVKQENDELDAEVQRVLGGIKEIIGGLSDLRYGKLSDGVEERALQALQTLQ